MPERLPTRNSNSSPRGWTRRSTPSGLLVAAYILALTLAAIAFVTTAWILLDVSPPLQTVAILTVLGLVGNALRERELGPHLGVSFGTVVLAAALPLVGPAGAAIVGYLSYLGDVHISRVRARFFNAAMSGCVGGAGGFVYLALGGVFPIDDELSPIGLLLRTALPLVAGYGVMTVLNTIIVGMMAQLVSGAHAGRVAARALRQVGLGYFTHVVVAFLFVILWEPAGVGMFSVVMILAPLLLTQWTLSRDAAERRSHARTVTTLVAALEAANPYSVGHSSRVAELCRRLAPRLGVHGDAAEELHFAALLHDIGLVAVAPRSVRPHTEVDISYLAAVVEHPEAGVRILQDIEFLADALPGILHHHERMDGRGYPAGLAGDEIPLFARMIAVADAFDSLTTTRSYREASTQSEALAALRSRSGTHVDGAVVEALADVLEQREWAPTLIQEEVRSALGEVHDHDDPLVSDRYAEWSPEVESST